MSLAPCLTNIDTSSLPLWGTGGGGGPSGPTITTSTVTLNTIEAAGATVDIIAPSASVSNPVATNDGLTFVANGGASLGPLQSTTSIRFDIAGQIGYIVQNPTGGVGAGNGMNILAGGITLGSAQGVEINGTSGNGAGSLTVSSITVSSINGATPGGGGGLAPPTALQLSTNTYFAPSDGLIPLGKLSTIPGHLYNAFVQLDTVSTFATPAADDRITLVSPSTDVPYCQDMAWWCSTMVHQPRGDSATFSWKADNTSTSVFHVYANGAAPSTLLTIGNGGVAYITDLGAV